MPKGPAPLSSSIRRLHNTERKARGSAAESRQSASIPKMPPEVREDADACAEWERIGPLLLDEGLVCGLDRAVLSAYCLTWGRWMLAERELAKLRAAAGDSPDGPYVTRTANGYPTVTHWLGIASTARGECTKLAAEFGLSPSSRTRVLPTVLAQRPTVAPDAEAQRIDALWAKL